ncbi:type II secretion system F family protein [bacterium]|nr:type II secretion system F family protein [bacterium]
MSAIGFLFAQSLILAAAWILICRRDAGILKRMGRYVDLKVKPGAGRKSSEDIYRLLDTKMERLPVTKVIFNHIEQLLTVANVPLKTSEFLIGVFLLTGVSLILNIFLSGGPNPPGCAVVLIGSILLPFALLKAHILLRVRKLRKQLKFAISILANNMKAGNSFVQALRHVTADLEEPLVGEFRLILNETLMGIPVGEALHNMSRRVPCPEMQSMVRGVAFQQDAGGNLVHILKTIFQTLQDHDDLRNKIAVLTIQGKISGLVCVSVPFFMLLLMHKTQSGYSETLFHTPPGQFLLALCAGLLIVGSFLVHRIVSFKI